MKQFHRLTSEVKDLRLKSRNKFMKSYKAGFYDENYKSKERDFKWSAHEKWQEVLNKKEFRSLMTKKNYQEIALRALKVESSTVLLFSSEEKALHNGVKTPEGAEHFAKGLYQLLYGTASMEIRFNLWVECVGSLLKKQMRTLTWPMVTAFGFIAQPETHAYLKPIVTKNAALNYGFDYKDQPEPNWEGYRDYLEFCEQIKLDLKDLKPRDMIDVQSFLSVQGSSEY
ncbi:MAG: hypothetical protein H7281_01125 [Bacteriovorax sp.]|nr:hypothetical protein [Bacteriovorax sp.]